MGYVAMEIVESLRTLGIEVDMIKPGPGLHALARSGTRRGRPRGAWRPRDRGSHRPPAAAHSRPQPRAVAGLPRCDVQRTDGARRRRHHPAAAWRRAPGCALSVGNSIAVDRTLRTSNPDIFSAGDCADAYHVVTGRKTWIPLALRANPPAGP